MKRQLPLLLVLLLPLACRHEPQPPPSAYDPELLKMAREAAAEGQQQAPQSASADEAPAAGECSREEGGCQPGYVCWDSYYCKHGFTDQCSAAGDKRCHKLCDSDIDCPRSAGHCRSHPIFNGSDRGTEVKFCVAE